MKSYVFDSKLAAIASVELDAVNKSRPLRIYSGVHAGKVFLPAALAERDERWAAVFAPLLEKFAGDVHVVELTREETTKPGK